jgi:MFS family permease
VDSSRRGWVPAIVVAAQFMFGVDAFIVNVAIPTIAVELHANWTGPNRTGIDPRRPALFAASALLIVTRAAFPSSMRRANGSRAKFP